MSIFYKKNYLCLICYVVLTTFSFPIVARSMDFDNDSSKRNYDKGLEKIEEFFNKSSDEYYGIKVEKFLNDDNMKKIKDLTESRAKSQGKSTKDLFEAVMAEEFEKFVFGDLTDSLKEIAKQYSENLSLKTKYNSNVDLFNTLFNSTVAFTGTLGLSAIVIGVIGALSAQTTAYFFGWIVIASGPVGFKAAIAAILAGPWGWLIGAGVIIASIVGYKSYVDNQIKLKEELKTKLINEISAKKPDFIFNWYKMVSFIKLEAAKIEFTESIKNASNEEIENQSKIYIDKIDEFKETQIKVTDNI